MEDEVLPVVNYSASAVANSTGAYKSAKAGLNPVDHRPCSNFDVTLSLVFRPFVAFCNAREEVPSGASFDAALHLCEIMSKVRAWPCFTFGRKKFPRKNFESVILVILWRTPSYGGSSLCDSNV